MPPPGTEGWARRAAETRAQSLAALPFERVETTGREALATWKRLRAAGRGWPVVIGGDEELDRVAEQYSIAVERPKVRGVETPPVPDMTPAAILARAAKLAHPAGLKALRVQEERQAEQIEREQRAKGGNTLPLMADLGADGKLRQLSQAEVRERMAQAPTEPAVGDWPSNVAAGDTGLTLAKDVHGQPLDKVHILLIPTTESAAVPAYLRWGGWNACPAPEYHVAALRSWHERYGAELVAIGGDVLNLRVTRRPQSRDEALALAREMYVYDEDIVSQGTETFAVLGATLMASDWWFFWWD
uniref:DUF4253 domain-containing protein n=1 Tax=Sphingomonas bacterium TaxID=1895847 RepID=UPI002602E3F6|nr:DUF4253 domain-containing protein [Sphingomonas bacterium]